MVKHVDDVVDVIVEIEVALGHGNHPGVDPVADIDVSTRQQRLDCAAQQCGIVARHRGDDQDARAFFGTGRQMPLEVDHVTEWLAPDDLFLDLHALTIDGGCRKTEGRLAVAARDALEDFEACGEGAPHDGVRPGVQRIFPGEVHRVSACPKRCHESVVEFVELIEHGFCTFVPDRGVRVHSLH